MATIWARMGEFAAKSATVAKQLEIVGVESEGQKTMRTESLPAAFFADSEGGGATAVMEDQSLLVVFEITGDGLQKLIRKIPIFIKTGNLRGVVGVAAREINKVDIWSDGIIFGFFVQANKGIVAFGEIIIGDRRRGGAENTGDILIFGDKTG